MPRRARADGQTSDATHGPPRSDAQSAGSTGSGAETQSARSGSEPSVKPRTIVALGDSTTAIDDWTEQSIVALGASSTAIDDWTGQSIAMYPELLPGAVEAFGIAARVRNVGIGDTTTREARERLDRDVRACSPDIVVILFGINDSWIDIDEGRREPRLTRDEYRDNLRHLVSTLKADGARVVLMTPTPMRWDDPLYIDLFEKNPGLLDTHDERGIDRLLDLYAQDVRDVAREKDVPLVDLHRAFEDYGSRPGRSISDLLLAGDGIHPSARGQELICELLAAEIARLQRR